MLFWGYSYIWYKQAFEFFNPITIVFFRLIISFPLLFITTVSFRRLQKIHKSDYILFLALAFFEPFLYFLGESFGMKHVSSTVGAIIISTVPLFTPFVTFFIYNEKIRITNYLGILISVCGVFVVVMADMGEYMASWKGIFLMLVAVLATQGYAVILKKLSHSYNSSTIVIIQNFIGALYFFPLFLFLDFKTFNIEVLSLESLQPVINLSIFASTLAFLFFAQGIRTIGMSRTVVFTNFIPVFTAIIAAIVLHESLGFIKALGIILVILGLIIAQSLHKR